MADDADAAARVIERLLVDPAFRADFRRDPATACSDAGLDDLADYMAQGAGKALHTLEIRESRSSLAGVMMAAALEGVGVLEFANHIVPGAIALPGAARDVLSRVNLPVVDGVLAQRGALAPAPGAAGAGAAAEEAGAQGPPGAATAAAAPPAQAPAAAPVPAPAPAPAQDAAAAGDEAQDAPAEPPARDDAPSARAEPEPAPRAEPEPQAQARAAAVEPQPAAAAVDPPAASAPVDPAQFGAEGTGGAPDAQSLALLENENVVLDKDGVADIKAGRIDPRVVAVLTKLSEDHEITVSCMCSDHPTFTTGGSVSNHHHGRGVDIAAIDGRPVNAGNPLAREVATQLASIDQTIRPNEVGTPWAISSPGYFTDADHADHLHVGFKQAVDPSWKPPGDQVVAHAAAVAPATAAKVGTLAIAVPTGKAAGTVTNASMSLRVPQQDAAAPPAQAAAPRAVADVADAPAGVQGTAGPKAMAALKEALKYKGTPYLWGGSNPDTGFDCSGLMQWSYAKQGIETGRTTYDQIDHPNATSVERGDLLPGDLVLFRSPDGDVHHVGMSMGGDKFLHAPRTGDVVKISSLDEPYYKAQFTGGRRFDDSEPASPAAAPAPAPAAVESASAALARDAAAVRNPNSMVFQALSKQEASNHRSTVQFLRAVRPEEVTPAPLPAVAAAEPAAVAVAGSLDYPGDGASKQELAAWLAAHAQKAGLPPELPVMAALVESGVANLKGGHADSVGFFQMRVGIWNTGEYAGYPERPELQAKWFIDHALALKQARIAGGDADFGKDPASWGTWIADVERPAEQYRGRYQLRLDEARGLLRRAG